VKQTITLTDHFLNRFYIWHEVVQVSSDRDLIRFKNLLEIIEKLIEENSTTPVIVEGKRDLLSLRRIGLPGEILILNTGESLISFCERIARRYPRAILLTDWDRKGKTLTDRIRSIFSRTGLTLDLDYRRKIAFNAQKGINRVELLASYIETKKDEFKL